MTGAFTLTIPPLNNTDEVLDLISKSYRSPKALKVWKAMSPNYERALKGLTININLKMASRASTEDFLTFANSEASNAVKMQSRYIELMANTLAAVGVSLE